MKKNIIIALTILTLFGLSACDTAIKGENHHIEEAPAPMEEGIAETNYQKISTYMEEECRKAFSPYYELLNFEIHDYQEEIIDKNTEAIFLYRLIFKNYDKDPDTVEYIKEAKERGNKNYQQMYDEYLAPKEMNFHLKVRIDENDSMTLYSNISPVGVEWEETKMTDFIMQ